MSDEIKFLYRVKTDAELTEDDLAVNPKGAPLTNLQIDANFNSLLAAIKSKSDAKDPVFPEGSKVDLSNAYLIIPVSNDDTKGTYDGSFRYNADENSLQVYKADESGESGSWLSLTAQAAGGRDNAVFWLNDKEVINSYTIPSNKNAMSAGPITITDGVVVTISEGSVWTIV